MHACVHAHKTHTHTCRCANILRTDAAWAAAAAAADAMRWLSEIMPRVNSPHPGATGRTISVCVCTENALAYAHTKTQQLCLAEVAVAVVAVVVGVVAAAAPAAAPAAQAITLKSLYPWEPRAALRSRSDLAASSDCKHPAAADRPTADRGGAECAGWVACVAGASSVVVVLNRRPNKSKQTPARRHDGRCRFASARCVFLHTPPAGVFVAVVVNAPCG